MKRLAVAACAVALCASGVLAQEKNWKATVTAALKAEYPNTKTATFERNNVTEPGVLLVVQKPSLMGEDVHNGLTRISTYDKGVISAPKGLAGLLSDSNARELRVGEKVYVLDIDVLDDG